MTGLSDLDVLDVWARGGAMPIPQRATLLLTVHSGQSVGELSVGERNARLIALRQQLYGTTLGSCTDCPKCGERLECDLDSGAFAPAFGERRERQVAVDGYALRLRAVTADDLGAIAWEADRDRARASLLRRCVLEAKRDGVAVSADDLPQTVVEAVAGLLAAVDPGAEMLLALRCPECNHQWESPLDVAAFVWTELEWHARRLLGEVHQLATSYGWNEAEILALPGVRRRAYLRLATP